MSAKAAGVDIFPASNSRRVVAEMFCLHVCIQAHPCLGHNRPLRRMGKMKGNEWCAPALECGCVVGLPALFSYISLFEQRNNFLLQNIVRQWHAASKMLSRFVSLHGMVVGIYIL